MNKKPQVLFTVEQAFNASRRDKCSTWHDTTNKAKKEKSEPEQQRSKNN